MHQNGDRPARYFAGVNCSGLRGDLLHREIFGVAPGTGSGDRRNRSGLLAEAEGGTLFLDEIGDMDLTVQAGLLAALQARSRLSDANAHPPGSGFRLICSSNQQLEAMAQSGAFLPELLCCISPIVLKIPPLRRRLAEFPGIVRHLLDGLRGPQALITDDAMRTLKGYRWPGNLRELKNALEQGLLLSHGARLCPEHFHWLKPSGRASEARPLLTMSELKEQHIAIVLQTASGSVNEVATSLGISRATMYRRLKQLRSKAC
jgi:DNA-binding NtrC family response regulator